MGLITLSIIIGIFVAAASLTIGWFYKKKKVNWVFMIETILAVVVLSSFVLFVSLSTNINDANARIGLGSTPFQAAVISQDSTDNALSFDSNVELPIDTKRTIEVKYENRNDHPLSEVYFNIIECYGEDKELIIDIHDKLQVVGNVDLIFPNEKITKNIIIRDNGLDVGEYRCVLAACLNNDCAPEKRAAYKHFILEVME